MMEIDVQESCNDRMPLSLVRDQRNRLVLTEYLHMTAAIVGASRQAVNTITVGWVQYTRSIPKFAVLLPFAQSVLRAQRYRYAAEIASGAGRQPLPIGTTWSTLNDLQFGSLTHFAVLRL